MQRLVQAWSELRHDEFFDLSPAAPSGIAPSGDMASRRPRLRAQCDQLLFYIGYMTMPQQVKDWLPGINVGEYIDFHARFSDDLPSAPHRTRILEWMVAGDTQLNEVVFDVTSGLIYKTKRPGWPQRWDMFWVIVSLLFFSFLVMFVIKLDNDNGAERGWLHLPAGFIFHKDSGVWQNDETLLRAQLPWAEFTMVPFTYLPHLDWMPAANLPDDGLFWGWLLVLGGMLLHWLVTFSKGQRQPRPPRFSTARVLPHVSAHKVRIIARFGLAIIAWVVASFAISSRTGNDLSATDYLGFLLAGYAVDSVTDLLSPYLDRQAGDLQTGTQSMPGVPDDGAPSTPSGR